MFTASVIAPLSPPPAAERASETVLRPLLEACGLGWFCLRAEGRREHLAAANLATRAQVDAFAPRIRVRRERRKGGVDTRTEALFPGYVFARFRYPEQVRHVVSTSGVLGLVAFGGPPPRLADATISHLRCHAAPTAPAPLAPVFEEGEWVRVAGGCFRGSEGRVRHLDAAQGRVRVLLSLLGHDVEISLPGDQLIAGTRQLAHVPVALRPATASAA
jgi:transcriptional antiterminator RfaH